MANIQERLANDVTIPSPLDTEGKLPGISYIPDKIELAEDKLMSDKVGHEILDFIRILTQLLDLMYLIKTKHLRTMNTIPLPVIREVTSKSGKGVLFKAFNKQLNDIPSASPSVEMVLKQQSALHPPRRRHSLKSGDQPPTNPFANDLLSITGKKTRPLWQTVLLEKQEEIVILKKKKAPTPELDEKTKAMYSRCKRNRGVTRTPYETNLFSIKFVHSRSYDTIANPDPKMFHQLEMMLASKEGFRTVEEHKAYLSTLESHWYTNFVTDALKLGVITCSEIIQALELLARHFYMNYNSLPFAKAKLCFIVMSLPFWDIVRPDTQRAVEYILENILLLGDKPLVDWLRNRSVPYVVFPPYSAEDFSSPNIHSEDEITDEGSITISSSTMGASK